MRLKMSRAILGLLLLAVPAPAVASEIVWPDAELWVTIGSGDAFKVPIEFAANPDGKTFSGVVPRVSAEGFAFDGAFLFDPDPFIQYGLGVQNLTAGPLAFQFLFLTPVVGGPYNLLTSSHVSGVVDGGNDDSITVTPFGGALIHRPQIDGAETAVGQLGDGCVVADAVDFCDVGGGSFAIAPVTPTSMGVTVAFTLSAGDLYSSNGRVELTTGTVPEPTTVGLLSLGLAALAARRRMSQGVYRTTRLN